MGDVVDLAAYRRRKIARTPQVSEEIHAWIRNNLNLDLDPRQIHLVQRFFGASNHDVTFVHRDELDLTMHPQLPQGFFASIMWDENEEEPDSPAPQSS